MIASDEVRYETIKEARDWYYVEYSPPFADFPFSTLELTIEREVDPAKVAEVMEAEARDWIARYPVPVMVTAFSLEEDRISLEGARPDDWLTAWPGENGIEMHWRLVEKGELPTTATDKTLVRQIFHGVAHRTGAQIQADYFQHKKQVRAGWWLVFVWAVFVPLGVAVLEWWSDLLGLVVLAFAFIKAAVKALRLTGKWPKSEREKEKETLELRMRHHHYHCERNPEGFERLKVENFRKEAEERSRAEAAKLRKTDHPEGAGPEA